MEDGSGAQPAPPLAEGRYKLIEVIGTGGMATVYRAFDERLHMPRAIKILSPAFARRPKLLARFEGEARTMARLEHANIVRVYDVGIDGDRAYIVMELLEAGSLVDRVTRHGPLAPHVALDVTADVLQALRVAHQRGVIHRDIKPHNVLVGEDGTIRVTDFGIARVTDDDQDHLTRTGAMMGTWAYMAPEQRANAKGVDVTADIYSVGATLYSLLTNLTPVDLFAADLDPKMLAGLPDPVTGLIRRATRYHREERFPDTDAMLAAVLDVRARLPPLPARALPVYVSSGAPQVHGATIEPGRFDGTAAAVAEVAESASPPRPPLAAPPLSEPPAGSAGDGTLAPLDDVGVTSFGPETDRARGALLIGVPLAVLVAVVAVVGGWWTTRGPDTPQPPAPMVTQPMASPEPPTAQPTAVEVAADAVEAPVPAPEATAPPETPAPTPVAAPTATAAPAHASSASTAKAAAAAPGPEQTAAPERPPTPEPTTAPTLAHTPVASASPGGTITFVAAIAGSDDYDQVKIYYRPAGQAVWKSRSMFGSGGELTAKMAVDESMGSGLEYFVDARSSRTGLPRLRSGSNQSPHRVTVD